MAFYRLLAQADVKSAIIACLKDNPQGTEVLKLERGLGRNYRTIRARLLELLEEGKIRKQFVGRASVYYVKV